MRNRLGFTLIELMVTVSIIAVAAALAVPTIAQSGRNQQLENEAIRFSNVFREARSRAILRGVAQVVSLDTSTTPISQTIIEGRVAGGTPSGSCRLSTFDASQSRVTYNDGLRQRSEIVVQAINPAQNFLQFCFTPSGRMFYRFAMTESFREDNGAGGANPIQDGFLFQFTNSSYPGMVARRVFVPLNGVPRLAL